MKPFTYPHLALCLLLIMAGCAKPLFVSHLTPEGIAMTKKKGYGRPVHKTVFARVMCFDEKCRKKAAWVKSQKKKRFKGYDSGPSLPIRERGLYRKEPDTLIASQPKAISPAAEPVQPITLAAPVLPKDSLIVLNDVLFEVNSFHLRAGVHAQLDSIAAFIINNEKLRVNVTGHTDPTGGEAHNQRLSENRARVVAEYLVEQGVPASRVAFQGYGSAQPRAENTTEEGRKRNRRVEIHLMKE